SWNQNQSWNQFNGNRPWGYNAYQSNWSDWHSGNWNNWNSCPAAWYGAGVASGAASSWMYNAGPSYAYSNPFYAASTYAADPGLDYSQPIQVRAPARARVNVDYGPYVDTPATTSADSTTQYVQQAPAPPPPADTAADTVPPEATQDFDAARAAFRAQDYDKALSDIDAGISVLSKDATMHEFRALVLFAQKKYKDAAAGIYAVLAVGPGWNWETMSTLYANTETYTNQLRELENYQRANPDAPDGHFLLAYHYLVIGQTQHAIAQLEKFA